jgi:hypothetical protein
MKNPIIEEVREAREALAAEHGYDRHRILEWAKKQHASRQKTVIQMSPNKTVEATADPQEIER